MSQGGAGSSNASIHMDAMRAVLAALVAFGHGWVLLIEDYRGSGSSGIAALYFLAGFAHPAVIIFFVLSGYWITSSVTGRLRRGWSWTDYLTDRASRLVVVIWPALLVGAVLDSVALYVLRSPTHLGVTGAWVIRKNVEADLALGALLGNMTFLQGIVVSPFGTNGPLWSVAAEFWYYIWFPALLMTLRARRPFVAIASLAIAVAAPHLAWGFVAWLCGSAVFFAEKRLAGRVRLGGVGRAVALAIGSALTIGALVVGRVTLMRFEDEVLALSFAALLLAMLLAQPYPLPLVRRIARYGHRASFSLYATHFPLMAFIAALALGKERLTPGPAGVSLVVLAMLAAGLFALGFATLTEARTLAVRRWWRSRFTPGRVMGSIQ